MSLMMPSSECAAPCALVRWLRSAGGRSRLERQVEHAENRVHRRADLMAHIGQELALGQVGRLGRLPCRSRLGCQLGQLVVAFGELLVRSSTRRSRSSLIDRSCSSPPAKRLVGVEQIAIARLDGLDHVVERMNQGADLVVAVLGRAQAVVLLRGDRLHGPGQVFQRVRDTSRCRRDASHSVTRVVTSAIRPASRRKFRHSSSVPRRLARMKTAADGRTVHHDGLG